MSHGVHVAIVLASILGAAVPASAGSGQVVNPTGEPIEGAEACLLLDGRELLCVETDRRGFFVLPQSKIPEMEIRAEGFLPRKLAAVDQDGPIRLAPAASLRVRLRDGTTREPIPEGRVWIVFSTGGQKGPFPHRSGGLVVRTLAPGEVVVRGEADGYEPGERDATLRGGGRTEIEVALTPAEPSDP